jgi:hypothetical protein
MLAPKGFALHEGLNSTSFLVSIILWLFIQFKRQHINLLFLHFHLDLRRTVFFLHKQHLN